MVCSLGDIKLQNIVYNNSFKHLNGGNNTLILLNIVFQSFQQF